MPIAPAVGAAMIVGGANLLGSMLGNSSQYKAAKYSSNMSYKISKEQMAWQEQMQDKQNAWNLDQWNRENEYNSAASQVQRFREAGINPALAMTGGASAGSAQSLESAPPASAPNMPQQYVPNYDFSGIGRAGDAISQIVYNAPKQAAEIDNLNKQGSLFSASADEAWARSQNERTRNMFYRYQSEDMKLRFNINNATKQLQIDSFKLQNDYLQSQINLNNMDAAQKQIINTYLPEKMQSEIALNNANTAKLFFEVHRGEKLLDGELRLLEAKIRETNERALKTAQERGLIPEISKDDMAAISKAYADVSIYGAMKAQYEAYSAQHNSHAAEWNAGILEGRFGMTPAPGSSRAKVQWWLEHIPFAASYKF